MTTCVLCGTETVGGQMVCTGCAGACGVCGHRHRIYDKCPQCGHHRQEPTKKGVVA